MKNTRLVLILLAVLTLVCGLAAEERTFQVGEGGSLDINLETGGSVEVEGSTINEVKVDWKIEGRDADNVQVSVDRSGERVRIVSKYIENRRRNSSSVRLRILIPNRFNLDIETKGGNINIANVEGKIDGETMGGNLVMLKLRGELKLSTMGGNISLTDSDVDGKVSTMGGNITVNSVAGDVDVSTMGGNVNLDNVVQRGDHSIDKAVDVSTMGGNIVVANAPHGANIETKGGNILIKRSSKLIEAETMGGNISINEHDGQVEASTMGGNILVTIIPGGTNQSIDVRSRGGRIELTLPSEFSGDFDLELAYTRKASRDYEIISDFAIQREETAEWDGSQGDARKYIYGTGIVGGGANKVKVRTVNGNIVIRKN